MCIRMRDSYRSRIVRHRGRVKERLNNEPMRSTLNHIATFRANASQTCMYVCTYTPIKPSERSNRKKPAIVRRLLARASREMEPRSSYTRRTGYRSPVDVTFPVYSEPRIYFQHRDATFISNVRFIGYICVDDPRYAGGK